MSDNGHDHTGSDAASCGPAEPDAASCGPAEPDADGCGSGTCGGSGSCGGHGSCGSHAPHTPVLDARLIDPVIRQSAIFGVLIGMPTGGAVTIVSDQDPTPISDLIRDRLPGSFEVTSERLGEQEWRVDFARAGH